MQDHPLDQSGGEPPSIDSLSGLMLVLFARPVGYVVLLMFAALIARRAAWTFSIADVLLWACAIAIPLAQRRVEVHYAAAGAGPPRPLARRIAVHLLVVAVLWAGAQSIHLLG